MPRCARGRSPSSTRPNRYWRSSAPPMTASDCCACRSEEHTSELQSLMRISYAVFCLKQKTCSKSDGRKNCLPLLTIYNLSFFFIEQNVHCKHHVLIINTTPINNY